MRDEPGLFLGIVAIMLIALTCIVLIVNTISSTVDVNSHPTPSPMAQAEKSR